MTGHQINSLVGDLVAMAQAMERLPQVEAELISVKSENAGYLDIVQRLELKLMDAKNLEDTLRASIRDLEVARDDAELRFLEADDKLAKLAKVFQVALEAVDTVDRTLTDLTAKPQPMEVPQANVDPTPVSAGNTEAATLHEPVGAMAFASGESASEGSVPSDPTAHGSDGNTNESATVPSPTAPTVEPVATKPWWEQDVKHD